MSDKQPAALDGAANQGGRKEEEDEGYAELPQNTSLRFRVGIWVSVVWLVGVVALVIWKRGTIGEVGLNEWGDFFAGVFAPLAFLWLVLGYLQQGDELRLSRDALLQQARELKDSAAQQRALVEVTREQLTNEKAALAAEWDLRRQQAQPKWGVFQIRSEGPPGRQKYHYGLVNRGADVFAVEVDLQASNSPTPTFRQDYSIIPGLGKSPINFVLEEAWRAWTFELTVSYVDSLHQSGKLVFDGQFDDGHEDFGFVFSLRE